MTKQEMDEIKELVTRELRGFALTNRPEYVDMPPCDIEAERVVLGALLSGEIVMGDVVGLTSAMFFLPLHRWIFECGSIEAVIAAAPDARMTDVFLAQAVAPLCQQAWCSRENARAASDRVIERADARAIVERLRKAIAGLCAGTLTAGQVRTGLGRV